MELKRAVFLHFDKIAAGAFGLLLLVGAGPLVAPPRGVGEAATVRAEVEKIETHMNASVVSMDPVEDHTAALRRQLDVPDIRPGGLPAWACHRRPDAVVQLPAPVPPVASVHGAPGNLKSDASHGKVALSWEAGKNEHLRVTRYEVWRKRDAGPFEKLTEISPETTRFVDTSVSPRSRYTYR